MQGHYVFPQYLYVKQTKENCKHTYLCVAEMLQYDRESTQKRLALLDVTIVSQKHISKQDLFHCSACGQA